MPYLIEVKEKENIRALFEQHLAAHRAYLEAFIPRMLATGALLEEDGSRAGAAIILFDTEERSEAEDFINNDPLNLAGVFASISITRWRKYIYDGKLMPQMEQF